MIYIYKCLDCNKVFEISGTITAVALQKHECPDCKSLNVQKQITSPNVHFHGNGWTRKPDEKGTWDK